MSALANTLELLALAGDPQQKAVSEFILDEYEHLLDMANDVYYASLETYVASLQYFGPDVAA